MDKHALDKINVFPFPTFRLIYLSVWWAMELSYAESPFPPPPFRSITIACKKYNFMREKAKQSLTLWEKEEKKRDMDVRKKLDGFLRPRENISCLTVKSS